MDSGEIIFLGAAGIFFGLVVYFMVTAPARKQKAEEEQRAQEEAERAEQARQVKEVTESAMQKVDRKLQEGAISESVHAELIKRIRADLNVALKIDQVLANLKRVQEEERSLNEWRGSLIAKYGAEDAVRIMNHEYWIGMTEEHLRECKGGPHKIERDVLKTKTKTTWIYGNKTSGDYFVFEDGKLVRFKDR